MKKFGKSAEKQYHRYMRTKQRYKNAKNVTERRKTDIFGIRIEHEEEKSCDNEEHQHFKIEKLKRRIITQENIANIKGNEKTYCNKHYIYYKDQLFG